MLSRLLENRRHEILILPFVLVKMKLLYEIQAQGKIIGR